MPKNFTTLAFKQEIFSIKPTRNKGFFPSFCAGMILENNEGMHGFKKGFRQAWIPEGRLNVDLIKSMKRSKTI